MHRWRRRAWSKNRPSSDPGPGLSGPLFLRRAGGMLMSADDRAVEHQPFEIGILTEFIEQTVDQAALQPAIIPPFDRLKGAEFRWQIFPSRPGARHPKQRVDKTPIIRARPVLAFAAAGDQRQNSCPLTIAQFIPI